MSDANRVEIAGALAELRPLRHTPAGVAVVEFRLRHESERSEAGARRRVRAEIEAIAFDALARLVAKSVPGRTLVAHGFLAAKSRRSQKPVLHVTDIEFE